MMKGLNLHLSDAWPRLKASAAALSYFIPGGDLAVVSKSLRGGECGERERNRERNEMRGTPSCDKRMD